MADVHVITSEEVAKKYCGAITYPQLKANIEFFKKVNIRLPEGGVYLWT